MNAHIKTTLSLIAFAVFVYLVLTVSWFLPVLMTVCCVIFMYYVLYNHFKTKETSEPRTQEQIDADIWSGYDH